MPVLILHPRDVCTCSVVTDYDTEKTKVIANELRYESKRRLKKRKLPTQQFFSLGFHSNANWQSRTGILLSLLCLCGRQGATS